MSTWGTDFRISAALAARLAPAGNEREQLTARHLERARQCCLDLLGLADECAPSTRVLVAYLLVLHDALAVLASAGWCVAANDEHVDTEVLEVLALHVQLKHRLLEGVRLVAAAREGELDGSFASDAQARHMQAIGLELHSFIEVQLASFGAGSAGDG